MKATTTAYLLAWINTRTGQLDWIGVHSESENMITHTDHRRAARLYEATAESFAEARELLATAIGNPATVWMNKYLDPEFHRMVERERVAFLERVRGKA